MPSTYDSFTSIPLAPPDPILGLTEAYNADTNPSKVNLGVGVYQNTSGKVPILKSVRTAEALWLKKEDSKSYLPIDGSPAYNKAVQKLLLGDQTANDRAVTVTALGGTGGLKVGADFLKRFNPDAVVYISTPSWENHRALFESAGFRVEQYRYYSPETHGLDFEGMQADLNAIPAGSIVILHACCHNPSGVDLSHSQWESVVQIFQERPLIAFLDFAYQGFGEGIEEDAFAVRAFTSAGLNFLVTNSFSKSFSLYRERVGALTVVTESQDEAKRVLSQLKRVIRTNYSSPASHGSQIVSLVLNDAELRSEWVVELDEMRSRIKVMRAKFVRGLMDHGVTRNFSFIEQQCGMFSFTGLPVEAVHRLRSEFGLYIVDSSRVCIAALNDSNINYVCGAIAKVI